MMLHRLVDELRLRTISTEIEANRYTLLHHGRL
jgi:hypothetical protein